MYARHGKRAMDLVIASSVLAAAAPLLLVLGVLVWARLGSPILFRQTRIGRDERPFVLCKFRTMTDHRDACGRLAPDAERLTRFGRWLRSTSLDELPELWHVVTGRMSLVGPRPLLPEYLPIYTQRQAKRHRVRPGITGLAQVNGRNHLDWSERLELDVRYTERIRLLEDLRVLMATVGVVLRRSDVSQPGHATCEPLRRSA